MIFLPLLWFVTSCDVPPFVIAKDQGIVLGELCPPKLDKVGAVECSNDRPFGVSGGGRALDLQYCSAMSATTFIFRFFISASSIGKSVTVSATWSLWLDVKIIVRTVLREVFRGSGG